MSLIQKNKIIKLIDGWLFSTTNSTTTTKKECPIIFIGVQLILSGYMIRIFHFFFTYTLYAQLADMNCGNSNNIINIYRIESIKRRRMKKET